MKVWIDPPPWMEGGERIEAELERIRENGNADITAAGMRFGDFSGALYSYAGDVYSPQELRAALFREAGTAMYEKLASSGALDELIEAKERMDRLLTAMRENALLRAVVDRVTGTQDG